MLNEIINILLVVLLLHYCIRNIKNGVAVYTIGTFIAPVLAFGGTHMSFDIWCFPIIFVAYLLNKKKFVLDIGKYSLLPYLAVYLCLSCFNAVLFKCGISIATIYATARFIIMLKIVSDTWEGHLIEFLDKVMGTVIIINAVCSVMQMMNIVPVQTFYDLYYKESMKPLFNQLELGYFNRAYGTTGSPVILGGISALTYTFYLVIYVAGKYDIKRNMLKMLASALCGLFALSKTAILAIPIMTVYAIVMYILTDGKQKIKGLLKIIVIIAVIGIVLYFLIPWMESQELAIMWYLKYLTEPFKAFSTRYDSDSGILAETITIIKDNIIFGVGHATFDGAFIGDSSYVVLLYETGIVGLVSYFLPYVSALFISLKNKDFVRSALVVVFLLIATGNSLHLSYWAMPFVALMFSEWQEQTKIKDDREKYFEKRMLNKSGYQF